MLTKGFLHYILRMFKHTVYDRERKKALPDINNALKMLKIKV